MKFLKTTSPPQPIWKSGKPTGETEEIVKYINPEEIISIEKYEGKNLHENWNCSKITYKEGLQARNVYDKKQPEELVKILETFKK